MRAVTAVRTSRIPRRSVFVCVSVMIVSSFSHVLCAPDHREPLWLVAMNEGQPTLACPEGEAGEGPWINRLAQLLDQH